MPRSRKSVHPLKYQEVSNRNFLSLVGFKFLLERCPKVDFFCNQANIPDLSLGTAIQTNYLRDIPVPGDKLMYGDLNLSFMVDEEMENYLQLYQWITALGFPESIGQFAELKSQGNLLPEKSDNDDFHERSDATLMILNSNFNASVKVKFRDLFPVSLSGIPFNSTLETEQYFTAQATFKLSLIHISEPTRPY